MKRTSRNPTRRKGPRTGAIPVSEKDITRILNKILRSPQVKPVGRDPISGVRYKPGIVMLTPKRRLKHGRKRTSYDIEVADKIASYATGKTEPLVVTVLDKERSVPFEHSTAGGWQRSERLVKPSDVPKKKRLKRIYRALEALGRRATPQRIKRLLDSPFARLDRAVGRTAHVSLVSRFDVPIKKTRLRKKLGDVLRHELAHAMDESARKGQMAHLTRRFEGGESELERDTSMATYILGLPRKALDVWEDTRPVPPPPRVKRTSRPSARGPRVRMPRVFDAAYYNDPKEVTARIVEILHELRESFENELYFAPKTTRGTQVVDAVRNSSPTFAQIEPMLTQQNFGRIMRAVWDRYHEEPWFPEASGVYKNRRTSRRVWP